MNYPHGDLLERKSRTNADLLPVLDAYRAFVLKASSLPITTDESIVELVSALNEYRDSSVYIFESGKNVPQANLRSSIMEEFLIWLFKDIFDLLDFDKPTNYQFGKNIGRMQVMKHQK